MLQWHQGEVVDRVARAFPVLAVKAVQFRLTKAGDRVERPTVIMPEPIKAELLPEERAQLDSLLAEMEDLIRKKSAKPEKAV